MDQNIAQLRWYNISTNLRAKKSLLTSMHDKLRKTIKDEYIK